MAQMIVCQSIPCNPHDVGRWSIIYCQNSMLGMKGFYFMASANRIKELTLS